MKRFSKILAILGVLAIVCAPLACGSAPITQAISGVSATPSSATEVAVTWRTGVESTGQVEYGLTKDYGSRSTLDSAMTLVHIVNMTGLAADTTYHFCVISKEVGAKETISDDYTFTTPKAPVTIAISNCTASNIGTTTATINWTTSNAGSTQMEFGKTSAYGMATDEIVYPVIEHALTLAGLEIATTYHYRVKTVIPPATVGGRIRDFGIA